MSNTFTETTSTSWFTRIRNSVGGVVIGLILIVGMVVLLFWNEGRAVQTYRSLAEGKGLSPRRIFFGYAMRNALLPQVTSLAIALGTAASGSVLVMSAPT